MVPMWKMARRDQANGKLNRETLKRAWGFARSYRLYLLFYLVS
ncbi:MAG: hypothetical protein QOF21_687, partial [Actinomycetota bacterium]